MILTTDSRIIGIDSNNKQVRLCRFEVDEISELPAQDVWASDGVIICMGSTAHVIGDNSEHMMDSSGMWVQQVAGASSYTREEIDALLQGKVNTSTYSTDKAALNAEIAAVANAGAKNILWDHEAGYSETLHGRKFTVLSDGGIKIEGTASDSTNADFYIIGSWSNRNVLLNESNERLTMRLSCTDDYGYNEIRFRIMDRSTGSTVSESAIDVNKDRTFSHIVTTVFISVWPIVTLPTNGIIVYPMIRSAAITDPTYEPYAPSNRELYEMILEL